MGGGERERELEKERGRERDFSRRDIYRLIAFMFNHITFLEMLILRIRKGTCKLIQRCNG